MLTSNQMSSKALKKLIHLQNNELGIANMKLRAGNIGGVIPCQPEREGEREGGREVREKRGEGGIERIKNHF